VLLPGADQFLLLAEHRHRPADAGVDLALLTTQLSFQLTGAVPPLRTRLLMGAKMLGWRRRWRPPASCCSRASRAAVGHAGRRRSGDRPVGQHGAGQMSNLAQSDEPAFRVKFEGAPPPQPQLYWRGPVLGNYDGRTWTRADARRYAGRSSAEPLSLGGRRAGRATRSRWKPRTARWLFALEMPQALPNCRTGRSPRQRRIRTPGGHPVASGCATTCVSSCATACRPARALDDAYQWLLLPWGRNPRALAAGRKLRRRAEPAQARAGGAEPVPPERLRLHAAAAAAGRDAVDDFLYGTRAGFCEHYAGAFVFLMRAAGVPARVVTGYQGGELNPIDGYLTVRQSDAHAWAEVWLPRRGWVRVDPTAAVAPERVQRGLARALPPAPFGLEGPGTLHAPDPDSLLAPAALRDRRRQQRLEPVGAELHAAAPARGDRTPA
jgi:transglutaminase-like putative cysteine protease